MISIAAASESFILTLVSLMLWEEGVAKEHVIRVLGSRDGILRLTRRELPPRLRGSWNEERPGALRDWIRDVVWFRNMVVHAGRQVHRQDALKAVRAVDKLLTMIVDRFAERAIRSRYPKTIVCSGLQQSLIAREAFDQPLNDATKQQLGWLVEFARWRDEAIGEIAVA